MDLAKCVNLSATVCQRRVQALFDKGIIDCISARIDPEALGYEVEAYVSVQSTGKTLNQLRNFARRFDIIPTCKPVAC